jgi:hypothetical protein
MMKKVLAVILVLGGLLVTQAASAWEWPFFSKKTEPAETPPVLNQTAGPESAPVYQPKEPLSGERLKFVVRSYAQTFDFHGGEPQTVSAGQLLSTREQSLGLAWQPTDYLSFYAEYSALSLTPAPEAGLSWEQPAGALGRGLTAGTALSFDGVKAGLKYFDFDYQRQYGSFQGGSPSGLRPDSAFLGQARDSAPYRGLEFSVEWQMDQTFSWNFGLRPYLALTRLLETDPSPAGWLAGQSGSDLRLSYGLVFNHEKTGLSVSVEASSLGRQTPFDYQFDGPDFSGDMVYDFHLVKRLYDWEDSGRLLWKTAVTNIGDSQTDSTRSKKEEGRTFKTGLRYEY